MKGSNCNYFFMVHGLISIYQHLSTSSFKLGDLRVTCKQQIELPEMIGLFPRLASESALMIIFNSKGSQNGNQTEEI